MAAADLGRVDVLMIGAGNAAANAALQAREMGASVAMLETARHPRPRSRQHRFRQLHAAALWLKSAAGSA